MAPKLYSAFKLILDSLVKTTHNDRQRITTTMIHHCNDISVLEGDGGDDNNDDDIVVEDEQDTMQGEATQSDHIAGQ